MALSGDFVGMLSFSQGTFRVGISIHLLTTSLNVLYVVGVPFLFVMSLLFIVNGMASALLLIVWAMRALLFIVIIFLRPEVFVAIAYIIFHVHPACEELSAAQQTT